MVQVKKMMRQEGEDKRVSELLYREVIQVILMFGSESWALSEEMMRAMDSTHVGLLHQIMGNRLRRKAKYSWETPAAKEVIWTTGMQLEDI